MDLFPPLDQGELIPVGFAEGRCDVFRMSALEKAGYYDPTLRLAGEDQVLAGKMRSHGFRICQAPHLKYYLSVSVQQDSLAKLPQHQRRFGRAHPYILLRHRDARQGAVGDQAGGNRNVRTWLSAQQLLATGGYFLCLVLALLGAPWGIWLSPLVALFGLKLLFFARHFREVRFTAREIVIFFAYQPVLDVCYAWGLLEGLWTLARRQGTGEIS
jgi:hypothetical protein